MKGFNKKADLFIAGMIALLLAFCVIVLFAGMSGVFTDNSKKTVVSIQQTYGDSANGTLYLLYNETAPGQFGYPEHYYPINNITCQTNITTGALNVNNTIIQNDTNASGFTPITGSGFSIVAAVVALKAVPVVLTMAGATKVAHTAVEVRVDTMVEALTAEGPKVDIVAVVKVALTVEGESSYQTF